MDNISSGNKVAESGLCHLAQNSDRWRAFVNTVMNLWVTYDEINLFTSWGAVTFTSTAACSYLADKVS
jgi:hypothetical protein